MKSFSLFRRECALRDNENCEYYRKPTQCHLLNCPVFAPDTPKRTKAAILRRMKDSVVFHPSDFDSMSQTTVQDLMNQARGIPREDTSPHLLQQPVHAEKPVQRLICMVCEEPITDDRFITIRDPADIIIYLHSKGKCEARYENTEKVRQDFLNRYKRFQEKSKIPARKSRKNK
ncbi:MAG: hypothetical protein ACFFE8_14375 [Candidatus Heimdallarchaeota archaeon]